ncbi:hypothetical protein QBC43DRAFT_312367 [Cladorrhinum sp. PSN259]|nr:hypothetical protein QBC43DRAFT_312367 [Cladorrhinum sp. PSN259]
MEQPQQQQQEFSRIYVGSLDYFAKPTDVEDLLNETGLGDFEKVHLSVDPISGRNPGYCFVEFGAHELASQALDQLAGKALLGRTLKLGPCYPKGSSNAQSSRSSSDYRPAVQRSWGRDGDNAESDGTQFDRHKVSDGTRVRVDGLPNLINQAENDEELRSIFTGFDVVAIGKRVIPYSLRGTPGNHHHCYVDFATKEEAQRASKELNGKEYGEGTLKTSIARPNNNNSHRNRDRDQAEGSQQENSTGGGRGFGFGGDRRRQQGTSGTDRGERNDRGKTIMEASSWRRA